MNHYYYEWDGFGYRWWREGDPGDVFDVIQKDELDRRLSIADKNGDEMTDHLPYED